MQVLIWPFSAPLSQITLMQDNASFRELWLIQTQFSFQKRFIMESCKCISLIRVTWEDEKFDTFFCGSVCQCQHISPALQQSLALLLFTYLVRVFHNIKLWQNTNKSWTLLWVGLLAWWIWETPTSVEIVGVRSLIPGKSSHKRQVILKILLKINSDQWE